MKKEVEVKIRLAESVSGFKERLKQLGAESLNPRLFEDNALFDTEDRDLKGSGKLLRVRTFGGRGLLTFKDLEEARTRHKTRLEIESAVGDPNALMNILERLGFSVSFRYQKYRESLRLGQCRIEIDETPVGNYVEIEGPPEQIDAQALALGFSEDDYILFSYADLFEQECARTGRDPALGMVFEPKPEEIG